MSEGITESARLREEEGIE